MICSTELLFPLTLTLSLQGRGYLIFPRPSCWGEGRGRGLLRRQDAVLVLAGYFGLGLLASLHLRRVLEDHLGVAPPARDHRVAVPGRVHLDVHENRLVGLPPPLENAVH